MRKQVVKSEEPRHFTGAVLREREGERETLRHVRERVRAREREIERERGRERARARERERARAREAATHSHQSGMPFYNTRYSSTLRQARFGRRR
jgi:hypothetical protein